MLGHVGGAPPKPDEGAHPPNDPSHRPPETAVSTPTVDFEVELPLGVRYALVSCVLEEGISKLTHAKVEIRTPEALDVSAVIRKNAGVTILLFEKEARRWTLRVDKVTAVGVEGDTFRYVVELHAFPWVQLLTCNTRKFRKMTAHAIISQVLGEGGVPFTFKTNRATPKRNYCIQYRESNWDFVSRLLEFEGIYYSFDSQGTLIFEDKSSACGPVDGNPHVELLEASGAMGRDKLGIHEVSRGARVQSGTATVNDYNSIAKKRTASTSRRSDSRRCGSVRIISWARATS